MLANIRYRVVREPQNPWIKDGIPCWVLLRYLFVPESKREYDHQPVLFFKSDQEAQLLDRYLSGNRDVKYGVFVEKSPKVLGIWGITYPQAEFLCKSYPIPGVMDITPVGVFNLASEAELLSFYLRNLERWP